MTSYPNINLGEFIQDRNDIDRGSHNTFYVYGAGFQPKNMRGVFKYAAVFCMHVVYIKFMVNNNAYSSRGCMR